MVAQVAETEVDIPVPDGLGNYANSGRRRVCSNCRKADPKGWTNSSGVFFCNSCWLSWKDAADPQGDYSGWLGSDAARKIPQPSSRLCENYGGQRQRFQNCCEFPWCNDSSMQDWDNDSWNGGNFSGKNRDDALDLHGLPYIDAHCHLDYCLLNARLQPEEVWTFKKWLCPRWKEGWCPDQHGSCEYAHGEEELFRRPPVIEDDIVEFAKNHPVEPQTIGQPEAPSRGSSSKSHEPMLRCIVHNCCEADGVADARTLATLGDRYLNGAIFVTFGCHPHNYEEYDNAYEQLLLEGMRACGSKVVGWGECGLDYYKNFYAVHEKRRLMVDVFARQARIAAWLNLPLVIHTRDAEEDTIAVLRDCLPRTHPVHIHAYQGPVAAALQILDMMPNAVIGLSGVLALKYCAENVKDLARNIPLERLVLETDAPYLSRDPGDIPKIARATARLKGVTPAQVLTAVNANSRKLYRLDEKVEMRHPPHKF